jgi:hypothetical protein
LPAVKPGIFARRERTPLVAEALKSFTASLGFVAYSGRQDATLYVRQGCLTLLALDAASGLNGNDVAALPNRLGVGEIMANGRQASAFPTFRPALTIYRFSVFPVAKPLVLI